MRSATILALSWTLAACGGGGARAPAPAAPADWEAARSVFAARCTTCHGVGEAAAGLRLDDWSELMAGSDHGEAVIAYDAARSLLVEVAGELRHPAEVGGARPLDAEQLAIVARWIEAGAPSPVGEIPFAESRDLVYVANQGSDVVSVIDASAGLVVRTVDLAERGYRPGAMPRDVAVEPDGSQWYLSLTGANRVLRLDRLDGVLGSAPFDRPGRLAIGPRANHLYVGRSTDAVDAPPRIGVIRTFDMTIEEVDVSLPAPHALAAARGWTGVYTGSMEANRIAAVAPAGEVVVTDVTGPTLSFGQFDVSPDGSTLVATTRTGPLLVFSLADPLHPALTGRISLGAMSSTPVYTPDGRYVFVGNRGDDTVSVVDMDRREVVATIRHPGLAEPDGAAVSRDGSRVFIANSNTRSSYRARWPLGDAPPGTVVIIDVESLAVVKVLEVEQNPTGVGARRAY